MITIHAGGPLLIRCVLLDEGSKGLVGGVFFKEEASHKPQSGRGEDRTRCNNLGVAHKRKERKATCNDCLISSGAHHALIRGAPYLFAACHILWDVALRREPYGKWTVHCSC